MSDVLQIALNRRNHLKAEITKLEEFLKMAEELTKVDRPEESLMLARSASAATTPKPAATERPRPMTNGAAAS